MSPLDELKKPVRRSSKEEEDDNPPGAAPYSSGPLAVSTPKPEPAGDEPKKRGGY